MPINRFTIGNAGVVGICIADIVLIATIKRIYHAPPGQSILPIISTDLVVSTFADL